ncbi:hypothetical protein NST99_10170 [Paenibacillus sp. FSL L8-0470]|uniref:hypothetical protein n=1 Tax=unclassified Paenibacillus TaxID=185978 RepID=UPI0030F5D5C4
MIRRPQNEMEMVRFRKAFSLVFKSRNPFEEMFQSRISERLLLYPTCGTYLDDAQFSALMESAKKVGDMQCYISEVEAEPDSFILPDDSEIYHPAHWEGPLSSGFYQEYRELTLVLNNAIYSKKGTWGVLISHEDHAVLGGSAIFVNEFKRNYPRWTDELTEFESMLSHNHIKYGTNVDWYEGLKKHLNPKA